ncbi:MAG: Unknown protein [uncultured Thiotrichaceae bacterium]|uniref:Peptidase C45 hydrolase domain-containing protein n=1 Tax=uncultured Thiotrichaceae bacterium TaxID=298394 RepID=A0A6S6UJ01_9GAMM|nr:MAG: Unknown protein [uncultured Thiotrichaceae bacterium]
MTTMRFYYLFCLKSCVLFIAYSSVYAGPTSPPQTGKIPIIHIYADTLPSTDIGLETGRQTKALFPDIEHRYDQHLATIIKPSQYQQLLEQNLPTLLKNMDQAYREELDGVASAWLLTRTNKLGDGLLSLDEYHLLNLLPDLGMAPDGSGLGVMGKASGENGPIVGRNMDWSSSPELRSLQTLTVYHYRDKTIVNIGFAGILSMMTGFNDQGLFLAYFNTEAYSPYQQTYQPPKNVRSAAFETRKALENSHSIKQASHLLSKQAFGFSHAILMADKKTVQVLEYPANGTAKIRTWDSATHTNRPWNRTQQIGVVDCHLLATLPNNCNLVKDSYHWERLRDMAQFSPSQPANVQTVSQILFDTANASYEIFNQYTLESLIFLPVSGSLYLYTTPMNGTHPSSPIHQPYLDLLPTKHRHKSSKYDLNFTLYSWLLLLTMVGIAVWVSLTPSKIIIFHMGFKKFKERLASILK